MQRSSKQEKDLDKGRFMVSTVTGVTVAIAAATIIHRMKSKMKARQSNN